MNRDLFDGSKGFEPLPEVGPRGPFRNPAHIDHSTLFHLSLLYLFDRRASWQSGLPSVLGRTSGPIKIGPRHFWPRTFRTWNLDLGFPPSPSFFLTGTSEFRGVRGGTGTWTGISASSGTGHDSVGPHGGRIGCGSGSGGHPGGIDHTNPDDWLFNGILGGILKLSTGMVADTRIGAAGTASDWRSCTHAATGLA